MSRTCSQCGNNGHNSRTCTEGISGNGGASGSGEQQHGIMLFGVRLTEGGTCFRKSVSMTNLSQYEHQPQDSNPNAGYESDDVVHASGRSRERKRGVPWTEEEHKLFLLGLQKVGKGDWRGISRNFVKTRTPTQVASHAQKYFLRRNNQNRRRRRSSLFDITIDTFMASPTVMEEEEEDPEQERLVQQSQINIMSPHGYGEFAASSFPENQPLESLRFSSAITANKPIRPIPIIPVPPSFKMASLNLNQKSSSAESLPLSMKLPTSSTSSDEKPPQAKHSSAFQTMSGKFDSGGDSIITVA